MRLAFISTLAELAEKNKDVVLLTGDLGFSFFEDFIKRFPGQYFNIGICEQNMIGIAAGLSMSGKKVFVYSIIPFVTFRCLEQIRNDICYHDLDVVIVGVGAGLSYGPLGFSHHAIEDIGALKSIPNITIISPSCPAEIKSLIAGSMSYKHPIYMRIGKSEKIDLGYDEGSRAAIKIGDLDIMAEGKGIALLTHGNIAGEVFNAYKKLKSNGFDPAFIIAPTIKPINRKMMSDMLRKYHHIILIEEHSCIGGLGDTVFSINNSLKAKILHIALPDRFVQDIGGTGYMRKKAGIDADSIYSRIIEFLK